MSVQATASEQDYIRILSDVVKIMQETTGTFIEGLKILE